MNTPVNIKNAHLETAKDLFVSLEEALPDIAVWQNGAFKGNQEIVSLLGEQATEISINRADKKILPKEDIWVEYLYFITDNPGLVESSIRVSIKDIAGKNREIPLTHFTDKEGKRYPLAKIQSFVKEIKFKSEAVLRRPKIKKIMINGFSLESFKDISEKIVAVSELSSSIDKLKQSTTSEVQEKTAEIKLKSEELSEILEKTSEHSIKLNSLTESIKEQSLTLSGLIEKTKILQQKEVALKSNTDKLTEESRLLSTNIAKEEQKLKDLENNKNVFSDEFVDYVEASKKHTKLYASLATIPLAVIMGCSLILYMNSNSFLHRGSYSLQEVASDFLLRIPFSAATISVAFLSWKICEKLVSKCIEIHQAQRDLSKLLVIAKETVFSSSSELSISDEIKFKERIRLKVQMIKNHLKKEISSDFDYKIEAKEPDDATPTSDDSADPVAPKQA